MHVVESHDDKSFGHALSILHYESKGTFLVQAERKLVIGSEQFAALQKAGLVEANGRSPKETKRGKKKK